MTRGVATEQKVHQDETSQMSRLGMFVVMVMCASTIGTVAAISIEHLLTGIPGVLIVAGSYGLATLITLALGIRLARFIRSHS